MLSGDLKVTVKLVPQELGKEAVETALRLAKGEKVAPRIVISGQLVTRGNQDRFVARP